MRDIWADWQPPSPKDPRVEITFGCKPFTPLTTCQDIHPGGPIPKGHRVCCGAKHCTGIEGHPALKRDRRTDPKPEPPTVYAPPPTPGAKLTRKQKRAAKFAKVEADKVEASNDLEVAMKRYEDDRKAREEVAYYGRLQS